MTFLRFFLIASLLTSAMSDVRAQNAPILQFIKQEPLYLPRDRLKEPSGLDIQPNSQAFWIVSDDSAELFSVETPPARVDVVYPLAYEGLEGVSAGWDEGIVLMVQEDTNAIVLIDERNSAASVRLPISKMKGYDAIAGHFEGSDTNKGLEGIAVDRERRRIFVVKEGKPRLLVEISSDLSSITAHRKLKAKHGFLVPGLKDKKLDISGLYYDRAQDALWMASDRGGSVFLYDLKSNRAVRLEIEYDGGETPDLKGIEGIALSNDHEVLYLVSDAGKESSLFTFRVIR
ncbi:hypothetical protein DS909_14290 [Phaeobacter gallaeciensis]|uniref:Phytase-like domain-containing protein n=2 Tax=Roseobacteraceae TaxID=2854170 RepID=A0A366WYV8_9RHOB|nr:MULTISPECIES: SdiA-regulated domain-containing protein [Roseobacteraceae]MBT3143796.1 SdiA-regulated domain-containing protein [Falsiruegeria litorea]MBT8169539.1 SdiA-regulated domain-containing protein [Falsiruegeria litorea]RBW53549.1 hypothetical protein DS909_14290 [Phaeobacter gallaeciensis]